MAIILRREIYLCGGDKRIIYTLPEVVDEKFASEISVFGKLKTTNLGDSLLWVVEFDRKMQLRFESGTNRLDCRFHRKFYKQKINLVEDFLKSYFDSDIQMEE